MSDEGRRRAVLLGCGTYGLQGCAADVASMRGLLEQLGFDQIEERVDADATRTGILDATEWLIAATRPGDTALLYWSGHGGRVGRPDFAQRVQAGASPYYQFLVPFDLSPEASRDGFVGLLSEEVTALQWRLTDAFLSRGGTPNVTTILDCCHAGYLARDPQLRPRAVDDSQARQFPLAGIRDRATEADATAAQFVARLGGADTNPYAVRLVAAQREQSAFERGSGDEVRGVFTAALVGVLSGLGQNAWRVPWSVIAREVRGQVQEIVEGQRPGVEGPGDLFPFSTGHAARPDLIPVEITADSLAVPAAELLGLAVGDVVELVSADLQTGLGLAEVERMTAGRALLRRSGGGDVTGRDVSALVRSAGTRRRGVRVAVSGASGADLVRRLADSARLKAVLDDEPAMAAVTLGGEGGLTVLDELGEPIRIAPLGDDEPGRAAVVDLLEMLARSRSLADLGSGEGAAALDGPISVTLSAVRGRDRVGLAPFGARVSVGERLSLTIANGTDQPVFCWVFDVGVSGRASLITNGSPDGTPLGPHGQIDDTVVIWGSEGQPLSWPRDVPTTGGGRSETFVVIMADRRQDLGSLSTGARRSLQPGATAREARSELERALDEVRTAVREMPAEDSPAPSRLRYRVERFSILVQPPP